MKSKLFRKIDVWEKKDDKHVKVYRCFEQLCEGLYYVQSVDHISYPVENKEIESFHEQQLELFLETAPDVRDKGYATLKEAIEQFCLEFEK